jgi:nucleotide-binding universal stress UspA family protein
MGYKRVLVGTDGSETAGLAVEHAAKLAAAADAELVIVTAFMENPNEERELESERAKAPVDLHWAITSSGQAEDKLAAARHQAHEAGATRVRTRVEKGDPASMLIGTAEELLCDVIVVGNKGMSGTSRFLLGSVPNKVSHHAPCDVLIVRTVS